MSEVGERSSKGLIQKEEAIRMEESMPDEWTNEKHYLYLKSMEAMFVEQLYNNQYNLTDSGWRSRRKNQVNTNGESNAKPQTSTQLEVLQVGCRKNVSVVGTQPGLDSTAEAHVLRDAPWSSHNIEVSDQNFVDKEDEPVQKSHVSKKKRMKEKVTNNTTKDQVVPTAQSPTPKNPNIPCKEKASNCTDLQSIDLAEGGTL